MAVALTPGGCTRPRLYPYYSTKYEFHL